MQVMQEAEQKEPVQTIRLTGSTRLFVVDFFINCPLRFYAANSTHVHYFK